jgi:hypothetical protein
METREIVKLILDYSKGSVEGGFTKAEAKEAIRNALIEANGGSTTLNLKKLHNGQYRELFDIITTVVDASVKEGLQGNEFFTALVDQVFVGEGDSADFDVIPDSTLVVADIAKGSQGIRRQRLGDITTINLKPTPKAVKIYEELARVLAGKADVTRLMDAINNAVEKFLRDDIYGAFAAITSADTGASYYPSAGTYDEDALSSLITLVESANDSPVMLVATRAGAKKLSTSIVSESAKDDMYKNGYMANWNGVPVLIVPQRLVAGTSTLMFDDDKVYILPSGTMDKPIKQVIAGESLMIAGDPTNNADMTQEFTLIFQAVTGVVVGKKFAIYEMS